MRLCSTVSCRVDETFCAAETLKTMTTLVTLPYLSLTPLVTSYWTSRVTTCCSSTLDLSTFCFGVEGGADVAVVLAIVDVVVDAAAAAVVVDVDAAVAVVVGRQQIEMSAADEQLLPLPQLTAGLTGVMQQPKNKQCSKTERYQRGH